MQGIIRHIEYNSNADVAYDTAFEAAATKGLGYFRIITDYSSPTSFDQEILIKRIRNSFSVYVDPNYQEPDGSDINWAFIFEDMPKEDYKVEYPNSELSSMDDWRSLGDGAMDWCNQDTIRVAEYFYKEMEEQELVLLSTKEVIKKDELPPILPEGVEVVAMRMASVPVIKWCKINATEILEETIWPGQWIPVIPVLGDELDVDGERILEGIVRHAKDPQRMYNYWASSETETIALAPRAPFIGVEGQFEGHEAQWKSANIKNHAYLEYKPKTIGGQVTGPPQRNVYEPPVQAITQARMQSSEDLKATTGIYDAALGSRGNEKSGVAIQRRNAQSQTANFHYVDNLSRALRHAGRILVEIIPKVYDTERAIRIIGEDDEQDITYINQVFEKNGQVKLFDLSKGKYDVTISNGPSYATKRQEAVESMLALSQSAPHIAQVASDLMVKNMDWPGADEIAERLKKTLPPGIAENEKKGEGNEIPPQVQQQMQQMQQMVDQLTQQLNQAQDTIQQKQLELNVKERIELAKIEADLKKELIKMDSREALAAFHAEIDQLNRQIESLGMQKEQAVDVDYSDMSSAPIPTGGPSPGQYME